LRERGRRQRGRCEQSERQRTERRVSHGTPPWKRAGQHSGKRARPCQRRTVAAAS
jgi:hypothetical protein